MATRDVDLGLVKGEKGDPIDVQINGTSIVSNNVANIPVADSTTRGVVCVANGNQGLNVFRSAGHQSDGTIQIAKASNEQITYRDNYYNPIVPLNLNSTVKSALTDSKRIGQGTVGTDAWAVAPLTDSEKANAREIIGANNFIKNDSTSPSQEVKIEKGTITLLTSSGTIGDPDDTGGAEVRLYGIVTVNDASLFTESDLAIYNINDVQNETWTFTLEDNTTVTKVVKVGASE